MMMVSHYDLGQSLLFFFLEIYFLGIFVPLFEFWKGNAALNRGCGLYPRPLQDMVIP